MNKTIIVNMVFLAHDINPKPIQCLKGTHTNVQGACENVPNRPVWGLKGNHTIWVDEKVFHQSGDFTM